MQSSKNNLQLEMDEDSIAVRLKDFMESQGISYSQFADACRIPRPSLSQILSGRNKKVSDVILRQIHAAFPSLSMLWLVFGEGSMNANASADHSSEGAPAHHYHAKEEADTTAYDSLFSASSGSAEVVPPEFRDAKRYSGTSFSAAAANRGEPRKVVSITVFYDDNSYETFVPSKK